MARYFAATVFFLAFLLTHTAHAFLDGRDLPGLAPKAVSSAGKNLSFENLSSLKKRGGGRRFKDNELLVKFKERTPAEKQKNIHLIHGSEKIKEFPRLRLHHVRVRRGVTLEEAMARYQADPDVEYVEPNYLQSVQAVPNDPKFGALWGLQNTGQTGGSTNSDIRAVPAWDITTGSSDVVVAVIDSGIDYTHPDLQPNVWVNAGEIPGNGIDDDGNGYIDDVHGINSINSYVDAGGPAAAGDPMDDAGHGTHVSGTIGAAGNDGRGVVGVNWSVKMIGCKFLDSSGSGWTSDAVECLEYVRSLKERGVNIVATSNSWGGGGYSQALYDAIQAQGDTLFIAAAGNSSRDMDSSNNYPAGYDLPNIVSVAATNHADFLASFSNYGKARVDVGAPGVNILSTLSPGAFGTTDGYGYLSGTSMATPHVTGLAALLKSQNPARNSAQIKNLIMTGGDSVTSLSGVTVTGRRINAYNSLTCSNRKLFAVGPLPRKVVVGQTYTVSVTSITCDSATGPVKLTTSEGDVIDLKDDGVAPDLFAGDGTFTARWTPRSTWVNATVSSPAGSQTAFFNDIEIGYHVPWARADTFYSQQLIASGGTPPYTWRQTDGYLQGGLNLGPNGVISGTPNESGTCNGSCPFLAEVTDALGNKVTRWLRLSVIQSWAQEQWGVAYDSTNEDRALAVALDASGNAYVTGESNNGTDLDLVLLKYATDGKLLWKQSYNRGDQEIGRSVACDKSGNVYVGGVTGDPGNHLLLKYDAAGNLLWEKVWDRGGDDAVWGVTTDASGNGYTVGTFSDQQVTRILLSKYSPAGDTIWTRVHDAAAGDQSGYSVALDGSGNIFLGGAAATADGSDFLIAKYDSSGSLLWSKTQHEGTSNAVSAVAADAAGNVYAAGSADSGGDLHAVIMKFDPAGSLLWKTTPTYTSVWGVRDIDLAPQGISVVGDKIFVAGTFTPWYDTSLLIIRYDSLGNKIWDYGLDVGTDSRDNGGTIAANSSGFTVAGYSYNGNNNDIFTARFTEPPPLYDVTLTGLSGVVKGNLLEYTLKAKNSTVGIPRVNVGLYLSSDATLSADDVRIDPVVQTAVAAGTEKMYTNWSYFDIDKMGKIPASLPGGSYYLLGLVDPDKKVNETNENNNIAVGNKVVVNSDLTVSGATGTFTDGKLSYSVTVKSSANFATPTSTTALYLSSEPGARGYLIASLTTPTPAAGTETLLSGTVPVPATVPPGTYYVTAMADCTNTIEESDESNNIRSGSMVTLANDLSLTALSGSTSGGTLTYSVTVRNAGPQQIAPSIGLYFSETATASATAHLAGRIDSLPIAGNSEATLTGTLVVPATVPYGSFFLTALADPANAVAETDESNNGAVAGRVMVDSTPQLVEVTFRGIGGGSITFTPGATCTGSCTQYYLPGTQVTLTPNPDNASQFGGWQGACTGTGSCTVVVTADQHISATFLRMIPAVSAGDRHGHALVGGELWSWGANYYGAFGDGTTSASISPRRVPGMAEIVDTKAGMYFSMALKEDGTVLSWGYNGSGQLGDGTTTNRSYPAPVRGLSGVAAIEAAGYGGVALLRDGTVRAWGDNGFGAVGDGTTTRRLLPVEVIGLSGVVALSSWSSHILALKEDGTVWAWGGNGHYQLGTETVSARYTAAPVPGITDVIAIAAGGAHSVALKGDGTVWTWGLNSSGQLGDGTDITRFQPLQVPGLTDVVAIAAGDNHTVALKNDGTVWAWGYNDYGQLGDGTTTKRYTPVRIAGVSGVTAIAAGSSQTFASKVDRTLWAWGQNYYGNLGDGSTTMRTSPVQVSFDTAAPITTASPAGGTFNLPPTVTLSSSESATIYYTLDGSTPTTASAIYTTPITVSTSAILKYFAKDSAGNQEAVKSETYRLTSVPPVADFSAAPVSGYSALSVTFRDLSTGLPSSWRWDFGDGFTSAEQNPTHIYTSPGTYAVSLTVSSVGGTSSTSKSNFISVSGPAWTLQSAYDAAADGGDIKAPAWELFENPIFERAISVRISGGYDSPLQQVIGRTVIHGKMTVKSGKVSLGSVVFK